MKSLNTKRRPTRTRYELEYAGPTPSPTPTPIPCAQSVNKFVDANTQSAQDAITNSKSQTTAAVLLALAGAETAWGASSTLQKNGDYFGMQYCSCADYSWNYGTSGKIKMSGFNSYANAVSCYLQMYGQIINSCADPTDPAQVAAALHDHVPGTYGISGGCIMACKSSSTDYQKAISTYTGYVTNRPNCKK
jgi:hypothetical protein